MHLLLCLRLELEVVNVQPTLGLLLLACPPSRALASIAVTTLDGTVPVADTPVALGQELVLRDVVGIDVPFDEGERPGEERVQLNEAGVICLEGLEVGAVCALGCPTAGDDRLDPELFVCSPSRLNLQIAVSGE